jgi:hypothetical protein
MQGRLRIAIAGALAIVGACAAPAPKPPLGPVAEAPPSVPEATRPPPSPTAPPAPRDACGALPLQYLVGKPRSDIPVPVNPSLRRVVCASCAVTQDYIASRQTITYDEKTSLVLSVRCG